MIRTAPALLLAFLAAALARGAGMDERAQRIHGVDRPAHPAFAFASLPAWGSSASGPLRPLPAGYRLLEYVESTGEQYVKTGINSVPATLSFVYVFENLATDTTWRGLVGARNGSTAYGAQAYNVFARKGSVRLDVTGRSVTVSTSGKNTLSYTPGTTTFNGVEYTNNSKSDLNAYLLLFSFGRNQHNDGGYANPSPQRLFSCSISTNGVLVRDYAPVADVNGVAGLWDRVSGQMFYSATATPLVAGPEAVDLESVDALLPSSRNWYRAWLSAPNPPAATPGAVAVDALVLPVGITSPIRDGTNALVEVLVADPPMLKALVQRYRSGLAPTNVPVNLAHSPTNVVGAVANLWWVEGEGVWARLLVPASVASAGLRPSCEILGLRAQATDAWGTWGDFWLPWQIRGVGLVERPALATPVLVPSDESYLSPYPGIIR